MRLNKRSSNFNSSPNHFLQEDISRSVAFELHARAKLLSDLTTMSPWTRLPFDLVVSIIEQANESASETWCLATRGNEGLHAAALAHAWKTTYITAEHLIAAPGEYEDGDEDDPYYDGVEECGELCKANRSPSSKINQAIQASRYIRHLYFDLNPNSAVYPVGYKGCQATKKTVEYSASLLLPPLVNLETVVLDGCVYDSVFENMPQCRKLRVRPRWTDITFRGKEAGLGLSPWPVLKWNTRLPLLEMLEVAQFTFAEEESLANFIETLSSLQTLRISVKYIPSAHRMLMSSTTRSPMHKLLGLLLGYLSSQRSGPSRDDHSQTRWRLPSSLRSLTLIDHYFLE